MDTKTKDMLMQVWGLHRSGSNFIEYLIRNNVKNNNYDRREVWSQFHGKRDALKHTKPDISYAEYHICIYKSIDQWLESHDRYNMKKLLNPRDDYWKWINLVTEFKEQYPDRVALVNYNDFIGKELWHFREWQNNGWKFELEDIFKIPIKRMGRESGTNFE